MRDVHAFCPCFDQVKYSIEECCDLDLKALHRTTQTADTGVCQTYVTTGMLALAWIKCQLNLLVLQSTNSETQLPPCT